MARNDVGSLVLDRANAGNGSSGHFRLWMSFSGAAFRRRIFDAVSCGGGPRHRHRHRCVDGEMDADGQGSNFTDVAARSSSKNLEEKPTEKLDSVSRKSEKLSHFLSLAESPESETDVQTKKKEEALEEQKSVVKDLQLEELSKRKAAASKIRLLAKEDVEVRRTLAMLGAIPPLVGMLDLEDNECRIASLYALLNLGIGNDMNKAAIVKAGAIHKMLKLVESESASDLSISEAIVANFLSLSALDSNKPVIGSSGAIPFLARTLKSSDGRSNSQSKLDAQRALYNLSIFPSNISFLLEASLIPFLVNALGDMEFSERSLSILSNVVATSEGRKAIATARDAFPILIDVLNWTDSSGCQEKASYILMVMAHKAYADRQAMIEAGVVSACLELTLLGSTLAQKRASRILECLRVDKGKQVSENFAGNLSVGVAVSAPIYRSFPSSTNPNNGSNECLEDMEDLMSEEKKAVKQLVQQSLQNNMRRIAKRANLPQDFVPSDHFKSLTSSSTSKSLPF